MKLTKEKIVEVIKKNWKKIEEEFGVKNLFLFGSYAYDKQKRGSDIDFLVEYVKGRGDKMKDFLGLPVFLKKKFRRKIDIGEREELKRGFRENILGGRLIKC
jgi:uncharacterized protein